MDHPAPSDTAPPLSKTQRKQAMHRLQELGEALVALPEDRLARIELPDTLREAVLAARRIRAHEGRRRQLQYVGKLMRRVDPEPIAEALAAFALGSATDALQLHEAEAWRERLIAEDGALTQWVAEHPGTDVQRLRQLIRGAREDAAADARQRSGRGYRELFKFVRQQLNEKAPDVPDTP